MSEGQSTEEGSGAAICPNDGKPFQRGKAGYKRFCSEACRREWWNRQYREARALVARQEAKS